jgi:proteasome lid subunit RPN8/RPN11
MAGVLGERSRSASELGVWSVSGYALSIEYFLTLLDEIRAYATDGLNRIRHGGIDVGGVLYGARDRDRVRILAWRSLNSEHAQGPSFMLSQNDEAALDALIAEAGTDPELNGLEAVGWFHAHTRSGVFLSDSDLGIYDRHFPLPWQIAMVLRPSQLGPAEVGFFFREPDGKIRSTASYSPFTVNPLLTPAASPKVDVEPVSSPPAKPASRAGAAVKRAASRFMPVPSPRRESPTGAGTKANWLWLAAIVPALGIGVLTGFLQHLGDSYGNPALNLRAYDHAGQVRIEWDRSAEPVLSVQKASLFISDGDQALVTEVSPELLQHGSMVYLRKSSNVEIRLSVNSASGPVQEWTRLIGLSAMPLIPVARVEAGDRYAPPIAKTRAIKVSQKSQGRAVTRRIVTEPARQEHVEKSAPEKPAPEPTMRASIATRAVASPDRSMTVTAPKPSFIYNGPTSGRVIWTGNLNAGASLEIDGDRASTGDLTGSLPTSAVRIRVHPANFSRRGIEVFARELDAEKEIREPPSANNGWTETVYRRNPKRAGDVVVTETPSAQNKWKRIGLRAGGRSVSAIIVDWEVMARER